MLKKPSRVSVKALTWRYFIALGLLGLIALANFFVLHQRIRTHQLGSTLLTIGNRQRMNVEFIILLSSQLIDAQNGPVKTTLRDSLSEAIRHSRILNEALIQEDPLLSPSANHSSTAKMILFEDPFRLDTTMSDFLVDASALAASSDIDLHQKNPHFISLITNHDALTNALGSLSFQYQIEHQQELNRLLVINRSALTVFLIALVLVGFSIFRPMVRQIAMDWNDLSTAHRKMEEDLVEQQRLRREIVDTTEMERRRIGNDLHDGLGQNLTGVALLSEALSLDLKMKSLPQAEQAGEIAELVNQSIGEVKNIVRGLLPTKLESANDFVGSLCDLAAQAERLSQIQCRCEYDDDISLPDDAEAVDIFRIVQEALTNAIKHSGAKRINITLKKRPGGFMISVEDNGSGLPNHPEKRGGMGLRIMHHRADTIGADLEIGRNEAGGTVVTLLWKMKEQQRSHDKSSRSKQPPGEETSDLRSR